MNEHAHHADHVSRRRAAMLLLLLLLLLGLLRSDAAHEEMLIMRGAVPSYRPSVASCLCQS